MEAGTWLDSDRAAYVSCFKECLDVARKALPCVHNLSHGGRSLRSRWSNGRATLAFHGLLRHAKLRTELVMLQPDTKRSLWSVRVRVKEVDEVPVQAHQVRGYGIKTERLHMGTRRLHMGCALLRSRLCGTERGRIRNAANGAAVRLA